MRIAVVNSFYRSEIPSGENLGVIDEVEALCEAGHEVELLRADSDGRYSRFRGKALAGFRVATGRGLDPSDSLARISPDVVHVNNLYPNFATGWIAQIPFPSVVSLHNFRLVCANGLLLRDGRFCDDCVGGSKWTGVRHKCYADSRLATLAVAAGIVQPVALSPVLAGVDVVHTLSDSATEVFARAGADTTGWVTFPNGVRDVPPSAGPRTGYLCVGRLTAEKGVQELLEIWPETVPLDVVGTGPLRSAVARLCDALPLVRLFEDLPNSQLRQEMSRYEGLVFPSRCMENSPRVVAEALCAGMKIVAYRGNVIGRSVEAQGIGFSYGDRMSLAEALEAPVAPDAPRKAFLNALSMEAWAANLESTFKVAIERFASRRA